MMKPGSLWKLLPQSLRNLPADLVAVVAVVIATNLAIFAPVVSESLLRIPLSLAFVLFVPGYAFVAALFPEDGTFLSMNKGEREGNEGESKFTQVSLQSGITGLERVSLSIVLSVAIVPLFGFVLNYTSLGVQLTPIVLTVSGFTLVVTGVAVIRRRELSSEERFRVPYHKWYAAGHAELFEPDTRTSAVLNVLVVATVLLALGSIGYTVMAPTQGHGEQFSAVYILTEDDDGELVANDYPTELESGESQELIVGVDNHEHRTVDYTVVVVEQDVETNGNEMVVEEQQELDRFETQLAHDETEQFRYDIEPTMTGEDVRIVWLLYPDEVPAEPSTENTEYDVHLRVNIND